MGQYKHKGPATWVREFMIMALAGMRENSATQPGQLIASRFRQEDREAQKDEVIGRVNQKKSQDRALLSPHHAPSLKGTGRPKLISSVVDQTLGIRGKKKANLSSIGCSIF